MIFDLHILLQFLLMLRVLLRPHREPASRLAWIVVILSIPVIGMVSYLLLGETRLGRRRLARYQAVKEALPAPEALPGPVLPALPPAEGAGETEVLVLDSGSTDGTLDVVRGFPVRLIPVDRRDFDHGDTRNLGALHSRGDVVVFLVQDAEPADASWLRNLTAPLRNHFPIFEKKLSAIRKWLSVSYEMP